MVHVAGDAGFTRAELDQLYRRHAPSVFRRARRLLGRDADAWDAVQEVFQKMVTAHQSFRGEARPMTWLYRPPEAPPVPRAEEIH